MQEDVEAELRLETIIELRKRKTGLYFNDENDILEQVSIVSIEICQMVEIGTGRRLGFIKGERDRCSIDAYKSMMIADKKYVNLHNHPNYSSHSVADLYILIAYNEINEVRVISADRTYVAIYEGFINISRDDFQESANEINEEVFKKNPIYGNISLREKLYKRNQILSKIYNINFYEELV